MIDTVDFVFGQGRHSTVPRFNLKKTSDSVVIGFLKWIKRYVILG